MAVVCYLDFDGVLHHQFVLRGARRSPMMMEPGHELFEFENRLSCALEPYPGVRVVLSTNWVPILGFVQARQFLTPALRSRVVGATFHRRVHGATRELRELWVQSTRGVQIALDIERRQPSRWFAIDDAIEDFLPNQLQFLVPCDGSTGLGSPAAQRLLTSMLERLHA